VKRLLALFLLVGLLAGCEPPKLCPCPKPCPKKTSTVKDGSVVFIRGGLLVRPIYRYTDSTLTHVAIIFYSGTEPWVYEAVPPCVHKLPLAQYLTELRFKEQKERMQQRGMSWFIMQPRASYTKRELEAMKWYAESQLGRPYMLRGWWRGREVRGIFCSQYVGDIIEQSGKIDSSHFRESPGNLHEKLTPFYQ
jgi:hypothetical protein